MNHPIRFGLRACSWLAAGLIPFSSCFGQDPAPGAEPSHADEGRGFLGLEVREVDPAVRAHLPILGEGTGLQVGAVQQDGPAARAGLRPHDILVRFDDQLLLLPDQLQRLARTRKPGDTVTLSILRGGKEDQTSVTLGAAPPKEEEESLGGLRIPDLGELGELPNLGESGDAEKALGDLLRGLLKEEEGGDEAPSPKPRISRKIMHSDDDGRIEISIQDGQTLVKATDNEGNVLFDGPCNTPEERDNLPPAIRDKVQQLLEAQPAPQHGAPEGFPFDLKGLLEKLQEEQGGDWQKRLEELLRPRRID